MPQGGGAYPMVRVREMLDLVAACSARPLDTGWLVRTLGLESCARLPYKRLSGGQQQRLSLACAVVGRPELVFLDEPTASLDPQGRHLVWDLVRALRGDGVAVLLTTHLMQEAEALADDVVIVDHGKVVAAGSPDELTATGSERRMRFRAAPGMDLATARGGPPRGPHQLGGPARPLHRRGRHRPAGARRGDRLVRAPGSARRRRAGRAPQPRGRLPRPHRAGAATVSAATPPPGTPGTPFPHGTFAPDPGIGSRGRMLAVHTRTETLLALRHSEQLLLTLVIPLALLVGLTLLRGLVDLPDPRVERGPGHRPRARDDVHRLHQPGHRAGLRPPLRADAPARRHRDPPLARGDGPPGRDGGRRRSSRWSCSAGSPCCSAGGPTRPRGRLGAAARRARRGGVRGVRAAARRVGARRPRARHRERRVVRAALRRRDRRARRPAARGVGRGRRAAAERGARGGPAQPCSSAARSGSATSSCSSCGPSSPGSRRRGRCAGTERVVLLRGCRRLGPA